MQRKPRPGNVSNPGAAWSEMWLSGALRRLAPQAPGKMKLSPLPQEPRGIGVLSSPFRSHRGRVSALRNGGIDKRRHGPRLFSAGTLPNIGTNRNGKLKDPPRSIPLLADQTLRGSYVYGLRYRRFHPGEGAPPGESSGAHSSRSRAIPGLLPSSYSVIIVCIAEARGNL